MYDPNIVTQCGLRYICSHNLITIGLGNDMSPCWRQSITKNGGDVSAMEHQKQALWNLDPTAPFFYYSKSMDSLIRKMWSILLRPQYD